MTNSILDFSTSEKGSIRTGKVFSKLLEAIVNGELRPNQRLVESQIAKWLGVSRTPVREAFKQLQVQGYVTERTSSGLIVTEHTLGQIRNLYEVREALEMMAIKLACQRTTESYMKKAEEYHLESIEAVKNRDIVQYTKLNSAFHEQLLSGCGNEYLLSLLRTITNQYFDRRIVRLFTGTEWRSMLSQHKRMLEAVNQKDARKAQKVVREHIKTVLEVAMERL